MLQKACLDASIGNFCTSRYPERIYACYSGIRVTISQDTLALSLKRLPTECSESGLIKPLIAYQFLLTKVFVANKLRSRDCTIRDDEVLRIHGHNLGLISF